jgi:hypothetical protein
MIAPTTRSSTSRRAHFAALWLLVAAIVAVSFWRHQTWGNRAIITLVIMLAVRGVAMTRDAGHLERSRIEDPVLSLIGSLGALTLMRGADVAPILAATVTGVVGGLSVRWVKGARDYHGAPLYVGAFVGITAPQVFHSFWWVVAAGVLAGVVWSVSRDAGVGVGGKMGTMALVSTVGVSLVAQALHQRGPGAPALDAHGFVVAAFVVGGVAASLTFYMSHPLRWGAVLGSSVPTASFALLMNLLPAAWRAHGEVLSYFWYGSSFVGMTTPARLTRPVVAIPLAGLLFTWLALRFGPYFSGLGGTAGVTALVAVFASRGAQAITRRPSELQHSSR